MGLMNLWLDRCFHCSLLCSALPSPGFGYLLLVVWRWEVGDTSHPYPPGKGLPQHKGSVPVVALASGCGQVGRQGLPRPSALCPAVCRHLSRRFAPASRLLSQGSLSPPQSLLHPMWSMGCSVTIPTPNPPFCLQGSGRWSLLAKKLFCKWIYFCMEKKGVFLRTTTLPFPFALCKRL